MRVSDLQTMLSELSFSLEYISEKSNVEEELRAYSRQLSEVVLNIESHGVQEDAFTELEKTNVPQSLKKKSSR